MAHVDVDVEDGGNRGQVGSRAWGGEGAVVGMGGHVIDGRENRRIFSLFWLF